MLAFMRAEALKLRRRPAVWICFGLFLALLLVFGYLLTYFILTYTKPPAGAARPVDYSALKQALYPLHFHQNTIGGAALVGGVLAMIIGALAQGSEYGWSTVKTAFTQGARRWQVVASRLAVLAVVTLAMSLAAFALAALTSSALAAVDGRSIAFPDAATVVKATLALWLIFGFWAAFGFGLATAFQQSAIAIGLGLAYALVIEALAFGLADQFAGDPARRIHQWFPLQNISFLAQSFGTVSPRDPTGAVAARPFAGATHAVSMLLVYTAAFVALAVGLTERRDVSS